MLWARVDRRVVWAVWLGVYGNLSRGILGKKERNKIQKNKQKGQTRNKKDGLKETENRTVTDCQRVEGKEERRYRKTDRTDRKRKMDHTTDRQKQSKKGKKDRRKKEKLKRKKEKLKRKKDQLRSTWVHEFSRSSVGCNDGETRPSLALTSSRRQDDATLLLF